VKQILVAPSLGGDQRGGEINIDSATETIIVSPQTPGSIHEGGELGYSISHAFGAAFDNPDLVVACVVGDGEAETGPLATAGHSKNAHER
jgi:transketolase N-terminal domain/subunit